MSLESLRPFRHRDQDSGMHLDMSHHQSAHMHTLQTQLVDNFEPDRRTARHSPNFSAFIDRQVNALQAGPDVRRTNLAVAAAPLGYGKTELMAHWMVELRQRLTGQTDPDFTKNRLKMNDERVVFYNAPWVSAVEAAKKLGVVRSDVPYGKWTAEEVKTISDVMQRGIEVAHEGAKDFEGIEGNAVGIIGVDAPAVTATLRRTGQEGQSEVIGYDRLFSTLHSFAGDPEMQDRIFLAFLKVNADDQHDRLLGRTEYPQVKTVKELQDWYKDRGLKLPKKYAEAMLERLPTSGGTVAAATDVARQMDEMTLTLANEQEISLKPNERKVLETELDLISQGKLLISPELKKIQQRKLKIYYDRLYPHIQRSIGLPEEQVYRGWNRQQERVNVYPGFRVNRDLFAHIAAVNERLLLPKTEVKTVYSVRQKGKQE